MHNVGTTEPMLRPLAIDSGCWLWHNVSVDSVHRSEVGYHCALSSSGSAPNRGNFS